MTCMDHQSFSFDAASTTAEIGEAIVEMGPTAAATTCTDHETRCFDESTPCWRRSHAYALVEMIAVRDDDRIPLATTWDYGHCYDGGHDRCDGTKTGRLMIPLPGELVPWLN